MELSPAAHRRILFLGVAIALIVAGRLAGHAWLSDPKGATPSEVGGSEAPASLHSAPVPVLRHPPSAVAELGVLTDRPEPDLAKAIDRTALAALMGPDLCGDEGGCAAVRSALADEHTTSLQVLPASAWNVGSLAVDGGEGAVTTDRLTAAERASILKRRHVVVVRVATAPSPKQVALRAAFAAAAAIAEGTDGLVFDQLLGRIESARDFAGHAVTAPLGRSAFRKDRVQLLFEPRGGGFVRMLTSGLSRWGRADVEAPAVSLAAADRVADIVLGVAEALADGPGTNPIALTRDDLAEARGLPYPADPDLPPATRIPVDLISVHPEGGDPNDFMARIEPPSQGGAGESPLAYLELSERFFGPLAASPDEGSLRIARAKAQKSLPEALTHFTAHGPKVLVRLPFPITGDAGTESMWIEVTRYDAQSVTGTLVDDPLGATDIRKGQEVTRPRSDVEDMTTK